MTATPEDQLGAQLSLHLHEEMSTMDPQPSLAATVRRRYTRRTWGIRLAAAVPAVAAIAVIGTLSLPSPDAPSAAGPGGTVGTVLDVNYVSNNTAAALADLSKYVRTSHEARSDGHVVDVRADAATSRERTDESDAKGNRLSSMLVTGTGTNNSLVVNYSKKVWFNDSFGGLPPLAPGQDPTGTINGPIYDPAVIKEAQDSGTLQLIGPETVAGQQTLHLRWSTIPGYTLDLWVSADTYLPVKHTDIGSKAGSTVTYEWLPRTPENLSKLDLTPPAGFTKGAPEDPRRR